VPNTRKVFRTCNGRHKTFMQVIKSAMFVGKRGGLVEGATARFNTVKELAGEDKK